MKLSVIIVSYNVRHYLEQCLRSVQRAIDGMEAEVIVFDNHSRDGSLSYLEPRFPWVTFVASTQNLGFAKANNRAIEQSGGEYVLLLNPDTIVGEEVLRESVAFMDAHERCGGLGVRMMKTDGTDARESRRGVPTPMTAFYKMVGLCSRFPQSRRFGRYYMGYLPWDQPAKIDIMSGACCLLRRRALDQVGLLDEDFFMYGEDIDLSYRLLRGGWDNWYLPLRILHYKGASTQKSNFRYVHVFYEAMFIFLRKHFGHLSFFLGVPIRVGIMCKAAVALSGMLMGRVRHSLGFVSPRNRTVPLYVFDGDGPHAEQCRHLVRHHALRASFEGDGAVPMSSDATVFRVYDVSRYSYGEILNHHARLALHAHIATYDPETRLLITHQNILEE